MKFAEILDQDRVHMAVGVVASTPDGRGHRNLQNR